MKQKPSDFDDFFSGIPPRKFASVFDRWLEDDPARAAKLWAVLDEAEKRGVPVRAVIERWNATEDVMPVKQSQLYRKWRDRQASK